MLDNRYDPNAVLACYPTTRAATLEIVAVPTGFSGAGIWKLKTADGDFCLRRWSNEHPDAGQLLQIHNTLRAVFAAGFARAPVPVAAADGRSSVELAGLLWQVEPWFRGEAVLAAVEQGRASI